MNKPKIGITMSIDAHGRFREGCEYLYINRAYAAAVKGVGGIPIHLSPDLDPGDAVKSCDAIIISGGDDIPAEFYNEIQTIEITPELRERIEWELAVLNCIDDGNLPVLGICYGMQLINIFKGGSLFQNIQDEIPNAVDHGGSGRSASHTIKILENSKLSNSIQGDITVSSIHRQAVKDIGSGLRCSATAADGVIEAIEGEGIIGVEWHPERDETRTPIYSALIEMAKGRRK